MSANVVGHVVRRTKGVSAAFIKELMRRSTQYLLEGGRDAIALDDVDQAIEEMVFSGGRLNRALLGGEAVVEGDVVETTVTAAS